MGTRRPGGKDARRKRPAFDFSPGVAGTAGGMYKPLTDHEVTRVHDAALYILEHVGIKGATATVRELAVGRGCRVDDEDRLLFPRGLIEDIVASAGRGFVLCGQDPGHDMEARANQVHFATGGAAVKMLDSFTGEYRPSTIEDLYDLARLCDTLPNIQWFTRPVVATEIADWRELDLNTVYACAAGTSKHLGTSIVLAEHVPEIVTMLDVMAGAEGSFRKRPCLSVHATTIVSPLTFAEDSSDVATAAARAGMPILSLTGPQSGATAPAALAGTLVQVVAETLGALAAINLVAPGHPVVAGGWPFVSDLRTGAFTGGGGEQSLLSAAMAQMMTYYDLPSGVAAGMADSKLPDNQAGYEKGVTTLLTAMSGPTFVYESAGMLASLLGCSLESTVIDAEMISNIRRCMRGIEVTDDTLSVEVIEDAARGVGHYLGHDQTIALMESEYVYPEIADRQDPDSWIEQGSKDMLARARERVHEVMTSHYPAHVSAEADAAIRKAFPIRLAREHMAQGSARWKREG